MTEVNDEVRIANADFNSRMDGCIYCGKAACKGPKCGKRKRPEVKSKPSALGCSTSKEVDEGAEKSGLAIGVEAHHLIPVKQCYARVSAVVWMGAEAGYDINDNSNGMALPGYHRNEDNSVSYNGMEGDPDRHAKFVMRATDMQWHAGGHNYQPKRKKGEAETVHNVSYDTAVLRKLLSIADGLRSDEATCEVKPRASTFIKEMNALSADIKTHIGKFKTKTPSGCAPYFVSRVARDFAEKGKRLP